MLKKSGVEKKQVLCFGMVIMLLIGISMGKQHADKEKELLETYSERLEQVTEELEELKAEVKKVQNDDAIENGAVTYENPLKGADDENTTYVIQE